MNPKYKNPYKKIYKLEIIEKIKRDGITYGKLEEAPFFLGSENLMADQIKINGEDPVFLPGKEDYFKIDGNKNELEIEIDWKNRLLIMQENLGNALVRYFLSTNTNSEIINYRVEKNSSYIDLDAKDFKFVTVKNIESLANYAIFSNLSIENFEGHIKIERLAEISYQGPALRKTGEIGMLLISSIDKINSALRLTLVSGENAYRLARNSLNLLDNMKMYLNSDSIESVFSDVKKLKAKNLPPNKNIVEEEKNTYDKVFSSSKKEDRDEKTSRQENFDDLLKNKEEEKVFDQEKSPRDEGENPHEEKSPLDPVKNSMGEKLPQEENPQVIENEDQEGLENSRAKKFIGGEKNLDREKNSAQEKNLDQEKNSDQVKSSKEIKNIQDKKDDRPPIFYQAVESFKGYATNFSGINYIYKVLEDVNLKELREISSYILREDNFVQIYGLRNGKRSKIIILRSMNLNFDLKKIYKKLQDHFAFTGTGNMYTLDLECKEEDLTRIMESFLIEIKREAR